MKLKKEEEKNWQPSSRRRFLKQSAVLAGFAAVGGIQAARAQGGGGSSDPRQRTEYVPDESVPNDHVLRDPWTGEMLRDSAGDLIVDWTGTPQWEAYRKNVRAVGGPRYGALEKDSRLNGIRSRYVTTYRRGIDGGGPTMPSTTKTTFFSILSPVDAQLGIITPSGLHFVDEHGEVPDIDPRQHRLTISGMVDRPLTFTMEELMDLPSVSRFHTVECNSDGMTSHRNRVAPWATAGDVFGELSCSEWTGVLLSTLFEMVGVKKGARWFYASAADEYNQTWAIPMWKAMDDTIIAYGQNGEPVRPEQGFPLRLLLPGFHGTANIKRLRRIKISDEVALWHRRYAEVFPDDKSTWFRMEQPPKSIIIRPSGGQQLTRRGFHEIRGIAWSGGGKITSVEVTVDGGKTWKDAEVQGPVHSKAHTRFVFPWSWNGEEVIIASRCKDERGSGQPTTAEFAKWKGVDVDTLKAKGSNRINLIQPWKIDREGRITNAVYSI